MDVLLFTKALRMMWHADQLVSANDLAQIERWLASIPPSRTHRMPLPRVVNAVHRAWRVYPRPAECLIRAASGCALLRDSGWPAQMAIGTLMTVPRAFHAWTVLGESTPLEPAGSIHGFLPVRTFPAA